MHKAAPSPTRSDHPAISQRIIGLKPEHDHCRRIIGMEPFEHRAHGVRPHERHIAIKHQHIARKTFERAFGLLHRVRRAMLRILHRDRRRLADSLFKLFAPAADDDDLMLRVQRRRACHEVLHHRPSGDGMQNLVQVAFHPGPLAGGKDDDSQMTIFGAGFGAGGFRRGLGHG